MLLCGITDGQTIADELMQLPTIDFDVAVTATITAGASTTIDLQITSSAPQGTILIL